MEKPLTAERLRELLNYNPDTGIFTYRIVRPGQPAGLVAGSLNKFGYLRIRIDGRKYMAHRLAWLYVHGVWPPSELDHRNRVKRDNRIDNLRPTTRSGNTQNQIRARADSHSGLKGARRDRSRWAARITVNGKEKTLGRFDTAEEAHACYMRAKKELHPSFREAQQ